VSAGDQVAGDLVSAREIDRPNSYVGRTVPRPNARRLLHGKGVFVDDMVLPRMLHVAFVRSPHAHARIRAIDSAAARESPGVVRIVNNMTGSGVPVPADNDYDELRRQLWLATDSAYKTALDSYAKKKSALEHRTRQEDTPDFSHEPVRSER